MLRIARLRSASVLALLALASASMACGGEEETTTSGGSAGAGGGAVTTGATSSGTTGQGGQQAGGAGSGGSAAMGGGGAGQGGEMASGGGGGEGGSGAPCSPGDETPCYSGPAATEGVGPCAAGIATCGNDGSFGPCEGEVVPELVEACNGVDDDCDGSTDEGFQQLTCGIGGCQVTVDACVGGVTNVCQPSLPQAETCNGVDDDCDGSTDEDNPGGGAACDTGVPGVCAAGTQTCQLGVLACVQNAGASAEVCDAIDNDCDGAVDDGNPGGGATCSTGLLGVCAAGTVTCQAGGSFCVQNTLSGAETCNGLDDDCDGAADENNPGGGATCSTGLAGVCDAGLLDCQNGAVVCVQSQTSSPETCNGKDDDCDAAVDENNPGGGAICSTGMPGSCATGTVTCTAGSLSCQPDAPPSAETCNALDDDCDGTVDEGNPGGGAACSSGLLGVCAAGTMTCTSGALGCKADQLASAELCDGLDNDCDGNVDDGNPGGGAACSTGLLGVCAVGVVSCVSGATSCQQATPAGAEVCDGLDNDCNGLVDDALAVGNPCSTGLPGVCAPGTTACVNGTMACKQSILSSVEACDGLDNDCDGTVDDGNPGGGAACSTGQLGVCDPGTLTCVAGIVECTQDVASGPELCDGLDNDCDGTADEGDPGAGQPCSTGALGVCAAGITACQGGVPACLATATASAELCDGLDNDCDGAVDDGNPGGGAACNTGLLGVCAAGTLTCQAGSLQCPQNVLPSVELCGNALDDDCDGTVDPSTVYFTEDFSDNLALWTLGTNWQIGSATASSGHDVGNPDPAFDHTPTADNGVAGVVIGGNAPTASTHPYYYLTSPIINASAASSLVLDYWRWLNSDYASYMKNIVQVYNGTTWVTVWETFGSPGVEDATWTRQTFDVSAHKNANLRVRIGYLVGSTGAFAMSQWNVDDVRLLACK